MKRDTIRKLPNWILNTSITSLPARYMCKTVQKNLPEYFYVLNIEYLKISSSIFLLKKIRSNTSHIKNRKTHKQILLFIKFKNNEQIHTRKWGRHSDTEVCADLVGLSTIGNFGLGVPCKMQRDENVNHCLNVIDILLIYMYIVDIIRIYIMYLCTHLIIHPWELNGSLTRQ